VPGPAVEPTVEPAVELARLRPHWLLYAPLVGSYLLAPVAAVAALQQYLDELHIPWFDRVADAVADRRPSPLLVAGAAVAVLLACAVGAVGTAAVANWGFRLTRRGGALVSERGLLSRRQVSLELDRVRGVTLAEPLSLRLVGAARLTALVTGLGGENTRRGQLLPLGPAGAASAVAAAVRPFGGRLRRHGPAALRRRLIRAVVPWLVLAAAAAALRWWWAAGAFGVLAAVGVPLALDRYRGLGHGLDDGALAVRSGSLRRRQATLDRRGVIGWQVRQTFFQRRAGLATVTVGTGAGGFDIIDVEVAEAVAVLAAVTPGPVAGLADPP
jgi:putative membrane protein